jgi:hypothetical protein
MIPRLAGIKRAFALMVADARSNGGDEGPDFLVRQNLVDARFLGVDEFSASRKNGLIATVPALFRGAAGRIALNDVDLGE